MAEPTSATVEFGRRVAKLRKQRGWSQTQLGERVGVSLPTIYRYEKGKSHPTLDVISVFASVFEVPEAELVGRDAA